MGRVCVNILMYNPEFSLTLLKFCIESVSKCFCALPLCHIYANFCATLNPMLSPLLLLPHPPAHSMPPLRHFFVTPSILSPSPPPPPLHATRMLPLWRSCRWDVLEWKFPDWAAVTGPAINILKGAILAADRVMTVSQVRLYLHLTAPVMPLIYKFNRRYMFCACRDLKDR